MTNGTRFTINWLSICAGFLLGIIITIGALFLFMPGMMILESESNYSLDETIAAIETAAVEQGWTVQSIVNMNKSLEKHGHPFDRQVRVIKICQPEYANSILTSDRQMSTMMPCSLAVYEADDGTVRVSQLNSGLMGTIFGGNVATVMGGQVAPDVNKILSGVIEN